MPSSSGLGFHGCDHHAYRPGERAVTIATTAVCTAPPCAPKTTRRCPKLCGGMSVKVPKGFLPTLFYACLIGTVPLLYHYMDYDYTKDGVRTATISASGVVALAVVLANDCIAWQTIALFIHLANEVVVLDRIVEFTQKDTSSDHEKALAWTSFAVIVGHLVPFFLVNYAPFLMFLAFVGVIVNTSVLVILDSSLLLVVGISSLALLQSTSLIASICDIPVSLLSSLHCALKKGSPVRMFDYIL